MEDQTSERPTERPNRTGTSPFPIGRVRRSLPVVNVAARTTGEAIIASLRKRAGGDPGKYHERTAARYAELMGRSKGVLMKAGQLLSFVPMGPAVPGEHRAIYQSALGRLQAEAPPMEPALVAETVEAELGSRPEKVFSEFSVRPLAAASIGQVHVARLHDGRQVAVKIQYPGVEQAMRADLKNGELLATFLQLSRTVVPGFNRMNMRVIAKEISERITEELDYQMEAANQAEFADCYRGHPFIHVPDVIPELSTRRILTQDLAEGMRWSQALSATKELRDCWGEIIWRFFVGSLRRLGLFNADPHPGNYLFHADGTMTFLDFGCTKRYTPEQVSIMKRVVSATKRGDAQTVWRSLVELGLFDPTNAPSPEAALGWQRSSGLISVIAPQPYTFTPEDSATIIREEFSPVGEVMRQMDVPADFVFISRIDLGMTAVLGELGSTGYWESIQAEYDEGRDPITDLGKQDAAFWADNLPRIADGRFAAS